MRIEIHIDNEEPQIFSLNKPKVVIGSQETCEIFLQHNDVSRKHLSILTEGDAYFVVDQGSTNGSFINEERLVPGRKVEFTSFFPVRLGTNVLVTLLSDEDANDLGYTESTEDKKSGSSKLDAQNDEATRTISLKELQSVKTEQLVKKRQETVVKRKAITKAPPTRKSSDSSRMLLVGILCLAMVGAAAYYILYIKVPVVTDLKPVKDKTHVLKKVVKEIPRFAVVDPVDFVAKDRFDILLHGISCSADLEKYLCEKFPIKPVNVIQVGTMLMLFLSGGDYYDQAKKLLPEPAFAEGEIPTAEKIKKFEDDLKFTALMLFLRDQVPKDLDYAKLQGSNLTFVVSMNLENGISENANLVIVPESLEKLLKVMEPEHFELAKKYGADSLYFLKDYLRLY